MSVRLAVLECIGIFIAYIAAYAGLIVHRFRSTSRRGLQCFGFYDFFIVSMSKRLADLERIFIAYRSADRASFVIRCFRRAGRRRF